MNDYQKEKIKRAAEILDSVYAEMPGKPAERMQAVRDELDGRMLDCLLRRKRAELNNQLQAAT